MNIVVDFKVSGIESQQVYEIHRFHAYVRFSKGKKYNGNLLLAEIHAYVFLSL
jgi:glycyl-tRNA synthetase beta subunit